MFRYFFDDILTSALADQAKDMKGTDISISMACKILVNAGITLTERAKEIQTMFHLGMLRIRECRTRKKIGS